MFIALGYFRYAIILLEKLNMKLASNDLAYEIQRKYLLKKDISGYKIGASNHKSANFFQLIKLF